MRVARVGFLVAIAFATIVPAMAPAAAPAATTQAATPSFQVLISPEYTTAGQSTTFKVTVVNISSSATTLGSAKLTPPAGFTPPHPAQGTPLRRKTRVQNRSLSLQRIALKPGGTAQLSITTTAPTQCGRALLHWTPKAFQGAAGTGPQLALNQALSSVGVTVLCPAAAPCAGAGPACSTSLVTSSSTYAVVSDAAGGTLRQTVNVGNPLQCGTYRFRDPNWYDSIVSSPTPSPPTPGAAPVLDTVAYKIRNTTAKGVGFCLGVAYDFTTASGAQAPAGTLPNGNPGFIGLLPMCSNAKPPCITSISQQKDPKTRVGFDALMQIQIPETGDPWGGG